MFTSAAVATCPIVNAMLHVNPVPWYRVRGLPLRRHHDCPRKAGIPRGGVDFAVIAVRPRCFKCKLIVPPSRPPPIPPAAARSAECAAIPHATITRRRMRGRPGIGPGDARPDLDRHGGWREREVLDRHTVTGATGGRRATAGDRDR